MSEQNEFGAEPLQIDDYFSPFKLLTMPEVLVAAKNGSELRPINLEINPINVCNQSCTWCTYGYLHDRRESLPKDSIMALLEDAKELGVRSVTWTGGGEPTVYKDLPEVVAAAAAHGFRQGINSNGTNVSPRLLELFVEGFSYVRFSVDAGSDDVYVRTHRVPPGLFARVIANIARLVEARDARGSKLTVGFSFLVDSSNVDDLLTAGTLAKSIGIDYFQVKPIVHYTRSNEQFADQAPMWSALERQLPELFALAGERFEVRLLNHKFRDMKLQGDDYGRGYDECRGNELLATVGADGSVDLCCPYKGMPEWSFGNIREQRFRDIWYGEKRQALLRTIDVKQCPPLCKAHEINKLLHFVRHFDSHAEFV